MALKAATTGGSVHRGGGISYNGPLKVAIPVMWSLFMVAFWGAGRWEVVSELVTYTPAETKFPVTVRTLNIKHHENGS